MAIFRITDRIKDMFIVGGFNCYRRKSKQPVQHAGSGPRGRHRCAGRAPGRGRPGIPVLAPGAVLDEAAVIAWCRSNMANYKVPRTCASSMPSLNAGGRCSRPSCARWRRANARERHTRRLSPRR